MLAPVCDKVILVFEVHAISGHDKLLRAKGLLLSRPFGAKSFLGFLIEDKEVQKRYDINLIRMVGTWCWG